METPTSILGCSVLMLGQMGWSQVMKRLLQRLFSVPVRILMLFKLRGLKLTVFIHIPLFQHPLDELHALIMERGRVLQLLRFLEYGLCLLPLSFLAFMWSQLSVKSVENRLQLFLDIFSNYTFPRQCLFQRQFLLSSPLE